MGHSEVELCFDLSDFVARRTFALDSFVLAARNFVAPNFATSRAIPSSRCGTGRNFDSRSLRHSDYGKIRANFCPAIVPTESQELQTKEGSPEAISNAKG